MGIGILEESLISSDFQQFQSFRLEAFELTKQHCVPRCPQYDGALFFSSVSRCLVTQATLLACVPTFYDNSMKTAPLEFTCTLSLHKGHTSDLNLSQANQYLE